MVLGGGHVCLCECVGSLRQSEDLPNSSGVLVRRGWLQCCGQVERRICLPLPAHLTPRSCCPAPRPALHCPALPCS